MALDGCINERRDSSLQSKIASTSEYKCTPKIIGKTELLEQIGLNDTTAQVNVLIGLKTMSTQ